MKIRPMPLRVDQIVDDVEHLRLHRDVERRGRLVGDQQVGFGDQHHRDHHPLAHAAGDFVRVEPEHAFGVVDAHRLQHGVNALRVPPGGAVSGAVSSASAICAPMVITGFSENFGSCITIEMRRAANGAHLPFGSASGGPMPSKPRRSAVTAPGGRMSLQDRAAGHRLAGAAFADDAEPLATERERDALAPPRPAPAASGR